METNTKTHWRKGDKSDYLMSWDIEAETRATIIKVVRMDTKVRGKTENCRVAFFKEKLKPMIINVTNGRVIEKALGSHIIQDWHEINLPVVLYVEDIKSHFADRALRLKPATLPELIVDSTAYKNAVKHIREGNDFTNIWARFKHDGELETKIKEEASKHWI